jgi:uncharacterized LabA/DUF88 family protein
VEASGARIALLIDADNAPAARIDVVLAEAARHGAADVRRAYGDWTRPHLAPWVAVLHTYAIRPMQQFAYSSGKNASDMAMVIDAMDLVHADAVSAFALVSSDADFTPLVMRLLAAGRKVYGFGERKTPMPFVNACSTFTFVDALPEPDTDAVSSPTDQRTLRGDTRLVHLLRTAVEAAARDDGWAHLGPVGAHIANQASFDPRNHGYRKLSDLVAAIGLFEVRREEGVVFVRDPRRG